MLNTMHMQSIPAAKSNRLWGICCFCVGLGLLSLWKSNQLLAAQAVVDLHEDDTGGGVSTLHARRNETKSPCLVAVTSSATYHFEVLESIASQLPLHYLNLSECDTTSLVFDFHIVTHWPPLNRFKFWNLRKLWRSPTPSPLSISWMSYFESEMKGNTYIQQARSPDSPTITRTVGELVVHPHNHERNPILITNGAYHATIEATCPCSPYSVQSLRQDPTRSCIFHDACPAVKDHPRAIWVSPYHEQFFIPTALPKMPPRVAEDPLCLCVIGNVDRRSWGLLKAFLDSATKMDKESLVRIQILGAGDFPKELEIHKDRIQLSSPIGYSEFHQRVAADCDAILLLLTKEHQPHYFHGAQSFLRLTGSLPLVMAYHKPVVMHQDLYPFYDKFVPSDLVAVTHTDETSSFVAAVWDLLDTLRNSTAKINTRSR